MNMIHFLSIGLGLVTQSTARSLVPTKSCATLEHQYRLSTKQLPQANAQRVCQEWGGTLATMDDELEKQQLASVFDSSNTRAYWVSSKNDRCITVRQSNEREDKFILTGGVIETADTLCNQLNPFICQKEPFRSKQEDREMIFRISTEVPVEISKKASEEACKSWGGELASLFGTEEKEFLTGLLDASGEYWINPVPDLDRAEEDDDWQKKCHLFEYRQEDGHSLVNWIDDINVCEVSYKYICEKSALQPTEVPDRLTSMTVANEGCDIMIKWESPSNCSFPITNYQIEIQGPRGYIQLEKCGTHAWHTSCTIPIENLPSELQDGHKIDVRGRACNDRGCSYYWSEPESGHWTIFGPPKQMAKARVSQKDGRSMTLEWDATPNAIHELEWDRGHPGVFEMLNQTKTTKFSFTTDPPNCFFQFRIRAKIKAQVGYCMGDFSESLEVGVQTVPVQMEPPTITANFPLCGVFVRWTDPHHGCSTPTPYKFELNGQPLEECNRMSEAISCELEMSLLKLKYGVIPGQSITVAGKSCNKLGCAETWSSSPAFSTKQLMKPPKLGAPLNIELPKVNALTLAWETIPRGIYKLQLLRNGAFTDVKVKDRTAHQYITNELKPGQFYKYRVQATNTCGTGEFSDSLTEEMPTVPGRPTVTVSAEGIYAIFSWELNHDGKLPVDEYKIEVFDASKTAHFNVCEVKKEAQGQRWCSIDMKDLQKAPFNLTICHHIKARIQARNALGWGEAAYSEGGPQVYRQPSMMAKPRIQHINSTALQIEWAELDGLDTGCLPVRGYQIDRLNDNLKEENIITVESNTTIYTLNVEKQCGSERIKVRAVNEYSHGSWSPETQTQHKKAPEIMAKPQVAVDQCAISIKWVAPVDCGAKIEKVQIEARTADGSFVLLAGCGEDPAISTCSVSMDVMTSVPFNLKEQDLIEVRAAAVNEIGQSEYSDISSDIVSILTMPMAMSPPRVNETAFTRDTMTLEWEKLPSMQTGGTPITSYMVYWDDGSADPTKTLAEGFMLNYTVSNMTPNFQYHFALSATNACGQGPRSTSIIVRMPTVPQKPIIRASADKCGVSMMWDEPHNGGLDIAEYKVEIQTEKSSKFLTPNINCNFDGKGERSCFITMADLLGKPYSLKLGSPVVPRVSARNKIGWSQSSDLLTDGPLAVIVYRAPYTVERPIAELKKLTQIKVNEDGNEAPSYTEQIKIKWKGLFGKDTGGSSIVGYEVHWDNGDMQERNFRRLDETSLTQYTVKDVQLCKLYTFKVRARNACEFGEFSQPMSVFTEAAPQKMSGFKAEVVGCNAVISWKVPFDCGNSIQRFIIEVQHKEGQFLVLPQCGNDGGATNCTVPMQTFRSGFGLSEGDSIIVKGVAINAIGAGKNSGQIETDAIVVSVPMAMTAPEPKQQSQTHNGMTIFWPNVEGERAGGTFITNYTVFVDGEKVNVTSWVPDSHTIETTIHGLIPDKLYNFAVQASNACGAGPVSKSKMARMPRAPDKPQLTISEANCNIVAEWTTPYSGGAPIRDYKLEIRQKYDWKDLHRLEPKWSSEGLNCETNGLSRRCLINMETLQEHPYHLDVGSVVVARISARNVMGYGEPSEETENGPTVYFKPNRMHQPTAEALNQTSIVINWQKLQTALQIGGSPIQYYQLYWDAGQPSRGMRLLNQTMKTSFALNNLEKCKEYSFQVLAANTCGRQVGSPSLRYVTQEVPKEMTLESIDSSDNGCSNTVRWLKPYACGSEITSFEVEVKTQDGNFLPVTGCGSDGKEQKCTIETKMITNRGTFGLQQGDLMIARVSAINGIGKGEPSLAVMGPMIKQGIVEINPPLLVRSECNPSRSSLVLSWLDETKLAVGGQKVRSYKLFWDKGDEKGSVAHVLTLRNALQTNYTLDMLETGKSYRFKLCAQTKCSMDIGDCSDTISYHTPPEHPYQQFMISSVPATWQSAQQTCQAWGGNLASLKDDHDRKMLYSVIDKGNDDHYWIALNAILQKENVWWIDRAECNYNNYLAPWMLTNGTNSNPTSNCKMSEPSLKKYQVDTSFKLICDLGIKDQGFTQTCVELYREFNEKKKNSPLQSSPLNCYEKRSFICQKYAGAKVFRVSNEALNLPSAIETCSKWGGKLAEARDGLEKKEIANLIFDKDKYWVGSRFWEPTRRRLQADGILQYMCQEFQSGEVTSITQCDMPKKRFICEKVGNDPYYPKPIKKECSPIIMWDPSIKTGIVMLILVCIQACFTLFCAYRPYWLRWRLMMRGIPRAPRAKKFPLDPFENEQKGQIKSAGPISRPPEYPKFYEEKPIQVPLEIRYRESQLIKADFLTFEPTTKQMPLNFQSSLNFLIKETPITKEKDCPSHDWLPDPLKILIPLLKGPKEHMPLPVLAEPGHEKESAIRSLPDYVPDCPDPPDTRERMCKCHGQYPKRVEFTDFQRKDRQCSAGRSNSPPRQYSISRESSVEGIGGTGIGQVSAYTEGGTNQRGLDKFLAVPHEVSDTTTAPQLLNTASKDELYPIQEKSTRSRPNTQAMVQRGRSDSNKKKKRRSKEKQMPIYGSRGSGSESADPKYRKFAVNRNRQFIDPTAPKSSINPVTGIDMQRFSIAVKVGTSTAPKINLLNPTTIIGSNPALMFHIDDRSVSFEHVAVEIVSGVVYLKQLSDNKRTFLNGTRVDVRKDMLIKLKHGDIMQFGTNKTQFIFGDRDWELGLHQKNIYYSQSEADLAQLNQKPGSGYLSGAHSSNGRSGLLLQRKSSPRMIDTVESVVSLNKINLNMGLGQGNTTTQMNQSHDQKFYKQDKSTTLSYDRKLNQSFDEPQNELNKSFNNSMRPKQNMSQSKFY